MDRFFAEVYRPLKLAGCSAGTIKGYELSATQWRRFCLARGVPGTVGRADEWLIAEFAAWRLGSGVSAATVNKDLRSLRAFLRCAVEQGAIPAAPRIKMLHENLESPRAFLIEEIQAILDAASRLPGSVADVPAADWWRSIVLAVYDTGGRIGAVLASRPADVDLIGRTLHLRGEHQKQRRGQTLGLHATTVEAIRPIWSADRERLWPWPWSRGKLYTEFRRLIESAGLETWSTSGSLWHRVRKSTASYLAAAGGDATFQLGHSTASVTARYLDPRICRPHGADMIPRPGE